VRHSNAAFYAYVHPVRNGFAEGTVSPKAAKWSSELGEWILDWNEIRSEDDPHSAAVTFARSAFQHACRVCEWDPQLPASAAGTPPPVA
jgi:hypothetical protein